MIMQSIRKNNGITNIRPMGRFVAVRPNAGFTWDAQVGGDIQAKHDHATKDAYIHRRC